MPSIRISTPATNLRALLPRFLAGLLWGGAVFQGGISCGWGQLASAPAPLKVAYLAELPVSWRTGLADPLRNIARSLGTGFARPIDLEIPLSADNVFGAESWDELSRSIQLGAADLFPIQAYEWVEHSRSLKIKPLLIATRNGRWQTRFLLLAATGSKIQSLHDLKDRTILIHRDGCGNLVDYWLDAAIPVGTGTPRKIFARYQTVTQAREAVLPVFFGEADACVVSEAAYQAVCAQNPIQIPQKMTTPPLLRSEEMPSQVVVCKVDLPMEDQRRVLEKAKQLTWEFGDQTGGLIPAEEVAFDHLRQLLGQRSRPAPEKPVPAPPPPTSRLQTSNPVRSPVRQP